MNAHSTAASFDLSPRRMFHPAMGLILSAVLAASPAQALTHRKLDFVVGVDGDFKAAMAAAKAASGTKRFVIFFPDGEYDIGSLTGDANQMTTFPTPNVSFVGQSADKTVVSNKSVNEGISITATLYLKGAHNAYFQDLTLFNKAVYGNTAAYNTTGRHVAMMEQADKVVYKNVKLKSTQDTYYTKGTRTYWEGGEIHGTTDFICGGGDVFFSKVLIWEMKVSAVTASQSNSSWGYVFDQCTLDGTVSGTTLGRSWGNARVVFLRTTMNKLPSAAGWGDPMNSVPKVFAEYKSVTSNGTAVDLSKRRTSYTKDGTTVNLDPVLSDAEAAKYTVGAVLGGTDNWKPQELASQIASPSLTQSDKSIQWADNTNALCWVVFRNGKYLANVATNSYDGANLAKGDVVTVRAANEMGGLGPSSSPLTYGQSSTDRTIVTGQLHHSLEGATRQLRIEGDRRGPLSVKLHAPDGSLAFSRTIGPDQPQVDISLATLPAGTYVLRYADQRNSWSGGIELR